MTFYARNFVYDNIPSETYNITLSNVGDSTYSGSSNIELFTESIYRRPKVYLYGTSQRPVLEFPVMVNTPTDLDADDLQRISAWLFGRSQYAKLQIVQPDMEYIYYNCLLRNPRVQKIGGLIRGIQCDVTCDSPFAWEFPKTYTRTYNPELETIAETVYFNNLSDDNGYLYPDITFTGNTFGGFLQITNANDASRVFYYSNLFASEVITINGQTQRIASSRGVLVLSNFNKNWFRLVRGINALSIMGNVSSLSLTYQFARKTI